MKNCPFCAEEIQTLAVVCKHCGRDIPTTQTSAGLTAAATAATSQASGTKSGPPTRLAFLILAALGAAAIGAVSYGGSHSERAPYAGAAYQPAPIPPRVVSVPDSAFEIGPESLVHFGFTIDPSQPHCHLSGHVTALSGGNKDVIVLVMPADDFTNWRNGHEAKVYFQSSQETAIPLDVKMTGPGTIEVVVSNAFSAFTSKTVDLQGVRMTCQ